MKTCAYCGHQNNDHVTSCTGCGTNDFLGDEDFRIETPPQTTAWPVVGVIGFGTIACLLSWLALISRPDSYEDVERARLVNWGILGPMWGATVLSLLYTSLSVRRKPLVAVGVAIVTWIGVAYAFDEFEQRKIERRSRGQSSPQYFEAKKEFDRECRNKFPLEKTPGAAFSSALLLTSSVPQIA